MLRSVVRLSSSALKQGLNGRQVVSTRSVSRLSYQTAPNNFLVTRRCFSSNAGTVMNVPKMGDSITEGTIVKWIKNPGDFIAKDDVLVVIETDKVSVDVRAELSGTVTEQKAKAGDTVAVGAPLVSILPGAAPAGATSAAAAPAAAQAAAVPAPKPVEAAKPVVAKAVEAPKAPSATPAAASSPAASKDLLGGGLDRSVTRVKMTRMRSRISERLKDAQNTAAMLTTFQEVDMGALIDLRKRYKDVFAEKHGVKLGFMSAFLKASAMALQEDPIVNAVIEGDEIVYRNYVDISVAVSTAKGLVVPAVRNVEHLSMAGIEKAIEGLAKKAKDGSITVEEMSGGTFTVSNGGVYGSLMGTPILNLPQSAILGMHATKQRPVVRDGKIEARPMMYLALTYDHRIIDGRDAVTFLCNVRDKIEDPARMLLEV